MEVWHGSATQHRWTPTKRLKSKQSIVRTNRETMAAEE